MLRYILYRLIFIFITLFFIILVNFIILNAQKIGAYEVAVINLENNLSGAKVDENTIIDLKKYFNLHENIVIRFLKLYKNYLGFNFGKSYYSGDNVIDTILSKLNVSIPFGFFSTLLIYTLSIVLGYFKARYNSGKFDNISTMFLVILYVFPPFVIGSILVFFFSPDFFSYKILLAIIANTCGGLLFISILSKNTFLAETQKVYYLFAEYKGLSKFQLFKNHLLKNFVLIVFADMSSIFLGLLFAGSLFLEILFNLDGIGLLSYESIINKDYPIILGSIYLLSFFGLFLRLINDILIMKIDKRIKIYKAHENNF